MQNTRLLAKIGEWLSERDSHSIYDAAEVEKSFRDATGEEPYWPVHSNRDTHESVAYAKAGGTFSDAKSGGTAWGYEIAYSLAAKYCNFHTNKTGRGFLFRDCLSTIQKAAMVGVP